MARILLGIGAIVVGLLAGFSAFVDRSVDWVERLDSPETYTSISTTTLALPEVAPRVFIDPTTQTEKMTPVHGGASTSSATQKAPEPKPSPVPPPAPSQKKVVLPAPSPSKSTGTSAPSTTGNVSEKAILDLTNLERVKEGKSTLLWNDKLASMAYTKAKDMLDRQYFAHESPDGKNVAGLAQDVVYVYRLVGENLALGNFHTNEELIAGWMNSPGHRANILKDEYTEIGTAAIEGTYEGDTVWMAVQEFGKPLPSCPKPDQSKKDALKKTEADLQALDESIRITRDAIETEQDETVRGQKIDEYNALVNHYNALISESKTLVNAYNESVRTYNACIAG